MAPHRKKSFGCLLLLDGATTWRHGNAARMLARLLPGHPSVRAGAPIDTSIADGVYPPGEAEWAAALRIMSSMLAEAMSRMQDLRHLYPAFRRYCGMSVPSTNHERPQ